MQNGYQKSGKLTSGYVKANKPKIKIKKKKKKCMVEEKRKKLNKSLSEKKEEARTVCVQRDKGWTHVIRVHDTTHLAVTTTRQGNRCSRTTPHKERMSGLVKH